MPQMTAQQLQAIDWNALLAKYGPLVLAFLKMFLDSLGPTPQLMAGAAPATCPHDDACDCCQEALSAACKTVACILACQQCCHDGSDVYG